MASWNPFSEGINAFPSQGEKKELNSGPSQDNSFWKIDLPGGGFIQMPGSKLPPASEGFIEMPKSQLPPASERFIQMPGSQLPPASQGFIQMPGSQPPPASQGFIQMPGSKLPPASERFIEMPESQLPPASERFIQMPGSQLPPASQGFIQMPGSQPSPTSQGFIEMPASQLPPASQGVIQMPRSQLPPAPQGVIQIPGLQLPPASQGFIQMPGSKLLPVSDDFTSPEERRLLMEKLDSLLENRAEQEQKLRDLLTDENSLRKCLKQVNDDLDMQCTELSRLTETLRASRNKMLHRVEQKKSHLVDLREMLFAVEKEERRTFSYRVIANESRALKKRIAEDNEEIKKQQRVVADLKATQRESRTRVKKILQEEKALWMKISEKVQWMVENGYPLVEPGNETNSLEVVQKETEGNPAESVKESIEQSADVKASDYEDEELASKDQGLDKQQENEEEDKPSFLENTSCTESPAKAELKEKLSQASPVSIQIDDEMVEVEPLNMSQASAVAKTEVVEDEKIRRKKKKEEKKREREEKKREKEEKKKEKRENKKKEKKKKEEKKKAEDQKRNNVLQAGLQTHDSMTLDPPRGTWADTASVTSTQSIESAAIPPTIVTLEAEIHQPTTNNKQTCVRTILRPSKKEILAQLASNREQLKLADEIEVLERLEFKEDENQERNGKEERGEETEDEKEEQQRDDDKDDEAIAAYLAMLEEEYYEVVEESSVKGGCFSFLSNFFGRFKCGSRPRKSRAARRKAMRTLSEEFALQAPTELVSGEVLRAHESN